MYLGESYENVLGAAVRTTKSARVHHRGMFTREMRQTAKRLGIALRIRRGFDLETDEGILTLMHGVDEHAVLLKAGLIFDGDGTVWEPALYLAHYSYRPLSLMVKDDD